MIRKKLYKCSVKGCSNKQPILSKGKCDYHRRMELLQKNGYVDYSKFTTKNKRREDRKCLKEFYSSNMRKCFKSITGNPIRKASVSNICHILPKEQFKSVMCDNDNCIYLTADEHARFDLLFMSKRFDDIDNEFPSEIIKNKLRKLYPRVEENNNTLLRVMRWANNKN